MTIGAVRAIAVETKRANGKFREARIKPEVKGHGGCSTPARILHDAPARLATRKPTIVGLGHVRENAREQLAARGSEGAAMNRTTNMARKRTVPECFAGTSPDIAI